MTPLLGTTAMSQDSNKGAVYEAERNALRQELHNLKGCQITFLTTTITATGLPLGLSATLLKGGDGSAVARIQGLAFFLPLAVIIPFWWNFFTRPRPSPGWWVTTGCWKASCWGDTRQRDTTAGKTPWRKCGVFMAGRECLTGRTEWRLTWDESQSLKARQPRPNRPLGKDFHHE